MDDFDDGNMSMFDVEQHRMVEIEERCLQLLEKIQHSKALEFLKNGNWNGIEQLIAEGFCRDIGLIGLITWDFSHLRRWTPLMIAAMHGHFECTKKLVEIRMNKEKFNYQYYHPTDHRNSIFEAARRGHRECFQFLMESRILTQDSEGVKLSSDSVKAAKSGNFDAIQTQLSNAEKDDILSRWGNNLMSLLIMYGCPSSCVGSVLDQGVDIEGEDSNDLKPLMCAVLAGNTDCVRLLLERGANVVGLAYDKHKYVTYSKTALMIAAALPDTRCLELMLTHCDKAAVEFLSPDCGYTAVTFACLYGNTRAVSLLIESGADKKFTFNGDSTNLIAAMESGNLECLRLVLDFVSRDFCVETLKGSDENHCFVENVDCLRLFVESKDLDVHSVSIGGHVLLDTAASRGYLESVAYLLDKGAAINAITHHRTPLFASCNDHSDVTELLINRGADVNIPDKQGKTPLMQAVCQENVSCAKLLLAAGADLDATSKKGDTVFTLAMNLTHDVTLLELLLDTHKLTETGALKDVHQKAMVQRCKSHSHYFTSAAWNAVMRTKGIFSWDWCTRYTIRNVTFAGLQASLSPGSIKYKNLTVSPLVFAFMVIDLDLIQYIVANLYFYPEDIAVLRTCQSIRDTIYSFNRRKLEACLNHVTSQPLTLQVLSFLTVSKTISLAVERGTRARDVLVDSLPVYDSLKRALNFQTRIAKLCRPEWYAIPKLSLGEHGDLIFGPQKNRIVTGDPEPCKPDCFFCSGLGFTLD